MDVDDVFCSGRVMNTAPDHAGTATTSGRGKTVLGQQGMERRTADAHADVLKQLASREISLW
jgi:hypothetical protein